MSDLKLSLKIIASGGPATVAQIRAVRDESKQASNEQVSGAQQAGGGIGAAAAQVAELAFRYNNVVSAVQNLVATARPAYDLLIGANEKLNAQLLSSQTNLASSSRVTVGGKEITDATAKIKATEGTLRAALKQIEIDTQSLVGVTSAQVNELFQITLTNAGALNNQSKQFPDAIAAATQLTKGWAASLKVVGIPLNQARQEINSIIKGQITQDSLLAKNLNITNQQVEAWRAQGKLVDELNKRLDVFVAGNAIAARSIEGIGSNIQDLIERFGRESGQPLLEPIISALAEVEKYLKTNEQAILGFFKQLTDLGIGAGSEIAKAFAPAAGNLLKIAEDLGPIALSAVKGLVEVLVGLSQVIGPLATLITGAAKALADFGAGSGGIVIQAGAAVAALVLLGQTAVAVSAAALPGLWAAALQAATLLGGLSGALTATAAGNVGIALSSPLAVAGLNALSVAAGTLTTILLPLAAAVAAVAAALTIKREFDALDAAGALEEYGRQLGETLDRSVELAEQFKRVKDAKAAGTFSAQDAAAEKLALAAAKSQLESINTQIAGLKALKIENQAQESQRQNNIKLLEAQAERIQKTTGGIVLEAIALTDLGKTADLAAKTLENFNRQIKSQAGGDKAAFEAALKGKIAFIQSEVQARRLTAEAARAELESLKSNTAVELETRNAAKEAIDKIADGRIAKIKELIEAGELLASNGLAELEQAKADPTLETSTRRKAAQQIVAIRKEQIAAETAAITTGQAQVAALQAQQRLSEAEADRQTTQLKIAELAKRQEATQVAIANAGNDTERAKLTEELRQANLEREKLEGEAEQRARKRLVEDYDERRNLLRAQLSLGLSTQADYNARLLANDQAQIDLQIAQQRENLAKLTKTDIQGQEAAQAKIAELQSKRVESLRQYQAQELKLAQDYRDQELKSIEAAYAGRQLGEIEFARLRGQNRVDAATAEINILQAQLATLGKNEVEGRRAIEAKIAEARSKRVAAFDTYYQAEIEQIRRYQAEANSLITESETQRSILAQEAANRQLTRTEQQEAAKLASQRQSLKGQLALAQEQERQLARLAGITRGPEQERQYQEQVRAARQATGQATLKLLEAEGAEIARIRSQAIKAIDDRAAASDRANARQLSAIKDRQVAEAEAVRLAELSANRQAASLDRVSKALALQTDLLKAQADLRGAIDGLANAEGDRRISRADEAIKLREKLDKGVFASEQERINAQRRLADLTGSNTQSLAQLQEAKAKAEREAEARKLAQLAQQQESARQSLLIQQQQADLAVRRSVLEARISKIKADQALLDAQSLITQERLATSKATEAARAELAKAQAQAPGQERDRAIADAQAKLVESQADGKRREAAAVGGVASARAGVDLAQQGVDLAQATAAQQAEINRLQIATLSAQQQAALVQAQAANDTERQAAAYARLLESARAFQQIGGAAPVPPALPQLQITPPGAPQIPSPQPSPGVEGRGGDVVQAISQLTSLIRERNPKIEVPITINRPQSDRELEDVLKIQRAAGRANL
jgi:hypothetical protein